MKKIFYQGLPGSFSFICAKKFFKVDENFVGVDAFRKIFLGVLKHKENFGILPIENTVAGSIYENLDLLEEFHQKVKVVGESYLRIEHHLLGIRTSLSQKDKLEKIKKIYSHPKALEQCQSFFLKHPQIEPISYTDTAGAALMVAKKNDPTLAAIASIEAVRIYGLEIIKKNLEDNEKNFTRFLIITQKTNEIVFGSPNKCSLIFNLKHQPGALASALVVFKKHQINLTKIQSRPIIGNPFEYNFFVDLEFNFQIKEMKKILKDFERYTTRLIVLGFYQKEKWQ